MKNLIQIKERYLKDTVPVRLGGLAANLARVKSFSKNLANRDVVFELFQESKFFIEWTAQETEIETTVELIELQLQIAIWQQNWQKNWNDDDMRQLVAQTSSDWSDRVLTKSGLLKLV